jgi:hypothetical protein
LQWEAVIIDSRIYVAREIMSERHVRNTLEDWTAQSMGGVMSWTVALNIPNPLREAVVLPDCMQLSDQDLFVNERLLPEKSDKWFQARSHRVSKSVKTQFLCS